MQSSTQNSDRLRGRYVNVSSGGSRATTPRATLALLAISVACGVAGSAMGGVFLSMPLLVISTVSAAAALVMHLLQTRPRRTRRRLY